MLALLISTWVSIRGRQDIPDGSRVPAHWSPLIGDGRYEYGKLEVLVDMPVLILAIGVLFVVLPLMLPHGAYLAGSMRLYNAAWIGALVPVTGFHAEGVARAARADGPVFSFGIFLTAWVLTLFGGYLMRLGTRALGPRPRPKMREWHPWVRTHWQAGLVLMSLGLALILVRVFVPGPALMPAFLAGILVACLVQMVLSWRRWPAGPAAPSGPGRC